MSWLFGSWAARNCPRNCLGHCRWTFHSKRAKRREGQAVGYSWFANSECLKLYSSEKSPAAYAQGRTQARVPARFPPTPLPDSLKRMLLSCPASCAQVAALPSGRAIERAAQLNSETTRTKNSKLLNCQAIVRRAAGRYDGRICGLRKVSAR